MNDSTTIKRIALALALLAAFACGILLENALSRDDAAYYRDQCERLTDQLSYYVDWA